jgi:recombinational DNA repair protein (RecF pathway)
MGPAFPRCDRCGRQTLTLRNNLLIGGYFCAPCDEYIRKPSPKLEAAYNNRVADRKRKETS